MKITDISPVSNPDLIKAINKAKENPDQINSNRMLNEAVKAKYLIPIKMESTIVMDGNKGYGDVEDANINFELLKANTGKIYYPVFTDLKELQKCAVDKNQSSMVVSFDDLAALLLQPMNAIAGFVINPMGDNICFSTHMIAAMKKDMEKRTK
ncbi:MAG: SseB family protein [Firmicutes bacterium]|nr:SseB family protein [Bacillota bacterium]MBR6799826.1 SseB family protein [Bacillota bacterium]